MGRIHCYFHTFDTFCHSRAESGDVLDFVRHTTYLLFLFSALFLFVREETKKLLKYIPAMTKEISRYLTKELTTVCHASQLFVN